MKNLPKVIGLVLLGIVVLIGSFIGYVKVALPNVGEPEDLPLKLRPNVLSVESI